MPYNKKEKPKVSNVKCFSCKKWLLDYELSMSGTPPKCFKCKQRKIPEV